MAGGLAVQSPEQVPDSDLVGQARRRSFTSEYKAEPPPAGHSQIAKLINAAIRAGPEPRAWCRRCNTSAGRFTAHSVTTSCKQRRQLGVEVGELSVQLTKARCSAGIARNRPGKRTSTSSPREPGLNEESWR